MRLLSRWLPLLRFRGSRKYWEDRYRLGGDAGSGSFGVPARYKAEVLNAFVADNAVRSVIEFGCGDGRQLTLAQYPVYVGIDVSAAALAHCRRLFGDQPDKQFLLLDDYRGQRAELALSLDVIYHLVEDSVYDEYLQRLFGAAERFVVIYSSDVDAARATMRHVRHRNVSADVARRFPGYVRMSDREAELPQPVEFNRGVPTCFLCYRRDKPA
jgi:SAM-dependent methyltransferase